MPDDRFQPHEITWTPRKIERLWRYYSTSNHHEEKYFGKLHCRQVASLLKSKGLLRESKAILDFSCGKGNLILEVSQHVSDPVTIAGIDLSEDSVRETRKLNERNPFFCGAQVFQQGNMTFPESSQDLIIATEVIEHMSNTEITDALHMFHRLLKPGGHLFLTTPNEEALDSEKTLCPECGCVFHRWQHMQSWSITRLTHVLESNFFRVVDHETVLWGPLPARIYFKLTGRKPDGLFIIAKAS